MSNNNGEVMRELNEGEICRANIIWRRGRRGQGVQLYLSAPRFKCIHRPDQKQLCPYDGACSHRMHTYAP